MMRLTLVLLLPALAAGTRGTRGIRGLYTEPRVPGGVALHAASNATQGEVTAKAEGKVSVKAAVVSTKIQTHVLRICNAHPKGALSVYAVAGETKTEVAKGMAWQQCGEFTHSFAVGDYLEFDMGGSKPVILPSIPLADTKALFVAYDKGAPASLLQNTTKQAAPAAAPAASPAASPSAAPAAGPAAAKLTAGAPQPVEAFNVWYHYFEKLVNAQVAVIDVAPPGATLEGPAASKLVCTGGKCPAGKVEVIPTGEAEPLFPGAYEMTVGQETAKLNLNLAAGECYAVLRMGKDTLMVFPPVASGQPQSFNSQPQQSGAASVSAVLGLLIALVRMA